MLTNCRPTCFGAYQLQAHVFRCLPTAGPCVLVLTNCRAMCFGAYQLQAHVFGCKLHISDWSATVHQASALQPVVLPGLLFPHCCRAVKWAGSQHLPKLRVSPCHSPHWSTVRLVRQTKDKRFPSVLTVLHNSSHPSASAIINTCKNLLLYQFTYKHYNVKPVLNWVNVCSRT